MKVFHRISVSCNPEVQRDLASFGIAVAASGFAAFDVEESDSSWPQIHAWAANRCLPVVVTTRFSKKEISEARWLQLAPDWHHGYPQPDEEGFGFRHATYDLSESCLRCGIGVRQRAPFQMKGEPKWGRNNVLQLNWLFDEFFVTPGLWSAVFEPRGIGCRPVLGRTGGELQTVVQLAVEEFISVSTAGLDSETCSECGNVKYLPPTRGFFPPVREERPVQIAKTAEYFGSGAAAHKRVLVSQELAQALLGAGLRGASLKPVGRLVGTGHTTAASSSV